jgi:hypothetical protein
MADMKPVIATTVIHRTIKPGIRGDKSKGIPATKPEVQIIKTGTRFIPKDQAEFLELKKAGAIKMPDEPAASVAEAEAAAAAAADVSEEPRARRARRTTPKKDVDENDLV